MIGQLPTALMVGNEERAIRSDFRVALLIFQAFSDPELTEQEKRFVMIDCLYESLEEIDTRYTQEALEKAMWFLNVGKAERESDKPNKKLFDWEQDEQIIFSAVNKVAGCETREKDYLHWWSFVGFYTEVGEGVFSSVVAIRNKKTNNKKLDKHEQEFYRDNKEMIDFKVRLTPEEQKEIDYYNELLGD